MLRSWRLEKTTTVNSSLECPLNVQPLQFLQAQSQPSTHGQGAKTELWAVVPASDWLVPLYGLTIADLPKCLHWILHIFNSYSIIFSVGWLERRCICKWGFCTFLLWGTLSGKERTEGEPMMWFWNWNVGIENHLQYNLWENSGFTPRIHNYTHRSDYFLLPFQEAGTWLCCVISWHLHIQKVNWPMFSTGEAFYRAASNLNMNSEEKLVKNIF